MSKSRLDLAQLTHALFVPIDLTVCFLLNRNFILWRMPELYLFGLLLRAWKESKKKFQMLFLCVLEKSFYWLFWLTTSLFWYNWKWWIFNKGIKKNSWIKNKNLKWRNFSIRYYSWNLSKVNQIKGLFFLFWLFLLLFSKG